MSNQKLHLYKTFERNSSSDRMPSATWGIKEIPNLMIYQDRHPAGKYPGWQVESMLEKDSKAQIDLSQKIAVLLQDQQLATRRDALRSINAVLLLLERGEVQ